MATCRAYSSTIAIASAAPLCATSPTSTPVISSIEPDARASTDGAAPAAARSRPSTPSAVPDASASQWPR